MQLVAMSINNVLAFLKVQTKPGEKVQLVRPEDSTVFRAPWSDDIILRDIQLDFDFPEPGEKELLPRPELLERYKAATRKDRP